MLGAKTGFLQSDIAILRWHCKYKACRKQMTRKWNKNESAASLMNLNCRYLGKDFALHVSRMTSAVFFTSIHWRIAPIAKQSTFRCFYYFSCINRAYFRHDKHDQCGLLFIPFYRCRNKSTSGKVHKFCSLCKKKKICCHMSNTKSH